MKRKIIIFVSDNWKESELAKVNNTITNRTKVERILSALNKKYYGFNSFTYIEVTA